MNDGVEAAEREADEERDTEAKTRTPHKDVGKKTCLTDFAIINFAGIHTLSEECCMHRTSLFSILHAALITHLGSWMQRGFAAAPNVLNPFSNGGTLSKGILHILKASLKDCCIC